MSLRHVLMSLVLASAAVAAQAQGWCGASLCAPLPDAVGTVQTSSSNSHLPVPPPGGRFDGPNGGGGILYQPLPVLQADSHVSGLFESNVAGADLVYFFRLEALRPFTGPLFVPVFFSGSWSASGSASGGARADAELRASVNTVEFDPFAASFSTTTCGTPCSAGGTWSRTVSLAAGTLYSMHLFVVTGALPGFQASASAEVTAIIDPSITVDPRFAADWVVVASAGVGTAPVPEPATALLFAAGAALLLSLQPALRARRPPSR